MNRTLRNLIIVSVMVALVAVGVWRLASQEAPDRLVYEQAARGGQDPVERAYRLTDDRVTIGRRADLSLPGTYTAEVAAVTTRQSDDQWTVDRAEFATVPVTVNGVPADGQVLSNGDVIMVGTAAVEFRTGPQGFEGFLDWWESNSITRLFFSFEVMAESLPVIARAFPVSLTFGVVAFVLGIPFGLILAFMKMANTRWLRWPATAYVDVIRGTPLFLQILIVYFGLTLLPAYGNLVSANPWMKQPFFLGLDFTLYLRGLAVLSLNSAAYLCEIFRAGIQSIPRGQMEAARSLGMTVPRAMTYVIIPQTIRRILPTMMSEFILLFKDTALLAAVGIAEMTLRAREVAASTLNQSAYFLAAAFYLVVTIPLGRFVARLEDKLAEAEGGGGKRSPLVPAPIDSEHEVAHSNPIPTSAGDRR